MDNNTLETKGTPLRFIMMRPEVLSDKNLTITEKLLYARICSFDEYYESKEACADFLGVKPDTVRKAKAKLLKLGYIREARDTGRGKVYAPVFDRKPSTENGACAAQSGMKMPPRVARKCHSEWHENATIDKIENKIENKDNLTTNVVKLANLENSPAVNEASKSKEVQPTFGNAEINAMFELWEAETGSTCNRAQKNRRACFNLLRKYGRGGLEQLIHGVALAQGERYAPAIANFSDLQAKQDQLLLWGRRRKNGGGRAYLQKEDDGEILEGF